MARLGANVTAIDACKENVIAAQLRAEREYEKTSGKARFYERLRYINCIYVPNEWLNYNLYKSFWPLKGSLEDLSSIEDNKDYFDAIIMSEVVEHVNNLSDFLANSANLLKVFKICFFLQKNIIKWFNLRIMGTHS